MSSMKLPDHLLRTYRRYKEEEQSLLQWIDLTARQLESRSLECYLKNRFSDQCQKRLSNIASSHSTHVVKNLVSILDILPSVSKIAQNLEAVSIPGDVAKRFETVYNLRKDCFKWYKSNTHQNDHETLKRNANHKVPLQVLEEAMDLLGIRIAVRRVLPRKSTCPTKSAPSKQVSTKPKECVRDEVDTPVYRAQAPTLVSQKAHSRLAVAKVHLTEQEKLQNEFNVARFCVLADIQQIEDFMVFEFVRFSLDQANSDVLSFLSDTAIDIVARTEDLLYETFDPLVYESAFLFPQGQDEDFSELLNNPVNACKTIALANPYLRMHEIIWSYRNHPTAFGFRNLARPFDLCDNYFGLTVPEQMAVEVSFIERLFSLLEKDGLRKLEQFTCLDSITHLLPNLIYCPTDDRDAFLPPSGTVFGIRLAMLATLILEDRRRLPCQSILQTSDTFAERLKHRNTFWNSSRYQSDSVRQLWPKLKHCLEDPKIFSSDLSAALKKTEAFQHAIPTLCTSNRCWLRMRYVDTSLYAMEAFMVAKVLAHLYNLLQEEGYLETPWTDLAFLLRVLGEQYMYQTSRPTKSRDNPQVLRARMMYAMGLKRQTVAGMIQASDTNQVAISPSKFKFSHSPSRFPLSTIATRRASEPAEQFDGAIDLELATVAIVVPRILGQQAHAVQIGPGDRILNRKELWRLHERGPGLEPVNLLASLKKGLLDECQIADFDFLSFEQVTSDLVDKMYKDSNMVVTSTRVFNSGNALSKIRAIALEVCKNRTTTLLPQLSKIFHTWLLTFGHVGVKGLHIAEQRPVPPHALLSSLRPEVLEVVDSISRSRGLRSDVFFSGQLDVKSIVVTTSLNEIIVKAWNEFKITRRTNRLETPRYIHPDLEPRR